MNTEWKLMPVKPTPEMVECIVECINRLDYKAGAVAGLRAAIAAAPQQPAPHPDDAAVDAFAVAMKTKLAEARAKGCSGWQTCPPDELSRMLREHVEKGDPRDVANFCMFLWNLGEGIAKMGRWERLSGSANMTWVASSPAQHPAPQPLTNEQINHLVDTHIGGPTPSYPLGPEDWINLARAIELAHGIK